MFRKCFECGEMYTESEHTLHKCKQLLKHLHASTDQISEPNKNSRLFQCNDQSLIIKQDSSHLSIDQTCDNTNKPNQCVKELSNDLDNNIHSQIPTHQENTILKMSCNVCSKIFYNKNSLIRHLRFHSGEGHQCNICNKLFSTKPRLEIHKRIHDGVRPFACYLCSGTFTCKDTLKGHLKIHSGVKTFVCEKCNRYFTFKSSLNEHNLRHHSSENNHKCINCSETFRTKAQLITHTRNYHTASVTKLFPCTICNLSFDRESFLKEHCVVHSDERSFGCNECEKKFKRKCNLYSHIRVVHLKMKHHQCMECKFSFVTPSELRRHFQSAKHKSKVEELQKTAINLRDES